MDLAIRDLIRRHDITPDDAEISGRLLAALLRQHGHVADQQLMAVPYTRYIRRIHKDFHFSDGEGWATPDERNPDDYQEVYNIINGLGGHDYWFPYVDGMDKEAVVKAIIDAYYGVEGYPTRCRRISCLQLRIISNPLWLEY